MATSLLRTDYAYYLIITRSVYARVGVD